MSDPVTHDACRRSLERSHARRAAAASRRWRRLRSRTGALALMAATAGLTGGAVAHDVPSHLAGGHEAGGARPALESIAACESGGNPTAVSADGTYRGKYQFTRDTWAALGGGGDPAAAPEPEQDRRAARLIAQSGTSSWPNCG